MPVTVEHCDPHCVAWALATASLWGMSSDHDLDEPVRLCGDVPVRLRFGYTEHGSILTDRDLKLIAERAATHIAIRFYFRDGVFHECDLLNVPRINKGETAIVELRRDRW